MKLIHVFLIIIFMFVSVPAQEIIDLGVKADFYEMQADANNVVHIFWLRKNIPYYGQVKNNKIIKKETIPGLGYVAVNKFRPRISVMPDGSEIHIAYAQKEIGPNQVKHAYKDSTGWHVKTAYTGDFGRLVQYISCAVDGTGVTHFIFVRYRNGSNDIPVVYVRKARNGQYIQKGYLSPKTVRNIWPDIYNDKQGNIHAVWSINKRTIHYRFARAGGDLSQSPTIDIPTKDNSAKQPDIFVDTENNVHLVYLSYNLPGARINQGHSYASLDNFDFTKTEYCNPRLIKMEGHYHDDPVIAAINPENVYISWAQETDANKVTTVELAKKTDGVWRMIHLDRNAMLKTNSKPAIAMSKNKVHIIWRSNTKTLKMYTESIGYSQGISAPLDGENVCGPLVYFEANIDPQVVSSVEFFVDGKSIGTSSTEPFSIKWNTGNAKLGQHSLSIKATKADNSIIEKSITVTLNCPPELSIINLVDGGCVSGTVKIELYANDDRDELGNVELYIDNVLVNTFTSAPYSYEWNTVGISEGSHTVKAKAYEGSGQTKTDSVTVTKCPVYQPLNISGEFSLKRTIFFKESSTILQWEANPLNTSVKEYRVYRILKGNKQLVKTTDPGNLKYKEVVDDSIEKIAYSVTVVDTSGRESTGAFVVLKKSN